MNLKNTFRNFCALVIVVVTLALGLSAKAQPWGTNTAGPGAHQYNDSLVAPLQPSKTLAEQLARGINTGSCVVTTDGTITNTFLTNYVYSAPPVVIVTQRGAALNTSTNIVVSVTTTNFVLRSGLSSVTNNWIAIGQ